MSDAALRALAPPRPGWATRVLIRRAGRSRFVPLLDGPGVAAGLAAGDEIIAWNIDLSSDADIEAACAGFNNQWYITDAGDAPWPDERAIIEQFIPPRGARVLEVCAGAGRCAAALVRDGNRVIAIDRARGAVQLAQALDRAGVRFLAADAAHLPLADRAFDRVCIFENSLGALFGKRRRAVEEMLRVCAAGGRLVIGLRRFVRVDSIVGAGDDGPTDVQMYNDGDGNIELGQPIDRRAFEALLADIAASARGRIGAVTYHEGEERPWGGRAYFAIVSVA